MTITFLVYLLVPQTYAGFALLTMKQFLTYVAIGLVVCFHWLTFYGSIKIGDSASVTLACMGSVAFFSSLFEPCFLGTSHSLKDIALGIVVLVGVFFIYFLLPDPPTGSHVSYKWAVIVGLISAMIGDSVGLKPTLSSLPLQIFLHFHWHYAWIFFLLNICLFTYKGKPSDSLPAEEWNRRGEMGGLEMRGEDGGWYP